MKRNMQKEELTEMILHLTKKNLELEERLEQARKRDRFGMNYGERKTDPLFLCKNCGEYICEGELFGAGRGAALHGMRIRDE